MRTITQKIPIELTDIANWVGWRVEMREGKSTKVPLSLRAGGNASTNRPETWICFREAQRRAECLESCAGLGFVITESCPFTGIDIDDCRDPLTGDIGPWALNIINALHSYTEVSPSESGVKIWVQGKLPQGSRNRKKVDGGEVEIYSRGRFFTVTGQHLEGTPRTIENRQTELTSLHARLFGPDHPPKKHTAPPLSATSREDASLLDRARNARNGTKFVRLFDHGDTSEYGGDDSRADMALVGMLAFWCEGDALRIKRLMRESALYREKYDRPDYLDRTIQAASADDAEKWNPTDSGGALNVVNVVNVVTGRVDNTAPNLWPELAPEAFHGRAGDLVRLIAPQTEADPAAILVQTLTYFGNAIGQAPHFAVESDRHGLNIFVVLVGPSAKGRKGTSKGHVQRVFAGVDEAWVREKIQSGLSSGEGLIWAVRDPIEETMPIKEKGRFSGNYETVVVDQGVVDKRLLVVEGEFSSTLKVMKREGNNLSAVIRSAWDSGDIQTLTTNSPAKATKAHVSIIGHITKDELLRCLDSTEAANGFGNRFLWVCARRARVLPEGGSVDGAKLADHTGQISDAYQFAQAAGELRRDDEAREIWHSVYPKLSEGKPGLLGAMIARAEAQVMRLAARG